MAGDDGDIEAQYRFWTEEKLRNADTDRQGHVNNAVMSSFLEAGRIELLDHPAIRAVRATVSIVVVRQLVNFRRELFYPGTVRIGTRVPRVGRTSLEFEHIVVASNDAVANAQTTCVMIDKATRKPVPVPDAVRAYLTGA